MLADMHLAAIHFLKQCSRRDFETRPAHAIHGPTFTWYLSMCLPGPLKTFSSFNQTRSVPSSTTLNRRYVIRAAGS